MILGASLLILFWALYGFLENSEQLRAAFGRETHEGIGVGAHLLTWYIAGSAVICSMASFGLGWLMAKRRRVRRPK